MFGSMVYALSLDVVNFVLTSLQGHEESSQKMVVCIVFHLDSCRLWLWRDVKPEIDVRLSSMPN